MKGQQALPAVRVDGTHPEANRTTSSKATWLTTHLKFLGRRAFVPDQYRIG